MTILKNVLLSLAIVPLTMSMSFAGGPVEIQDEEEPMIVGGAGKATFKEFTMKEEIVAPTVIEERRVIRQRVDILKAQALAIAATENTSDDPTVQKNKTLRDD